MKGYSLKKFTPEEIKNQIHNRQYFNNLSLKVRYEQWKISRLWDLTEAYKHEQEKPEKNVFSPSIFDRPPSNKPKIRRDSNWFEKIRHKGANLDRDIRNRQAMMAQLAKKELLEIHKKELQSVKEIKRASQIFNNYIDWIGENKTLAEKIDKFCDIDRDDDSIEDFVSQINKEFSPKRKSNSLKKTKDLFKRHNVKWWTHKFVDNIDDINTVNIGNAGMKGSKSNRKLSRNRKRKELFMINTAMHPNYNSASNIRKCNLRLKEEYLKAKADINKRRTCIYTSDYEVNRGRTNETFQWNIWSPKHTNTNRSSVREKTNPCSMPVNLKTNAITKKIKTMNIIPTKKIASCSTFQNTQSTVLSRNNRTSVNSVQIIANPLLTHRKHNSENNDKLNTARKQIQKLQLKNKKKYTEYVENTDKNNMYQLRLATTKIDYWQMNMMKMVYKNVLDFNEKLDQVCKKSKW